MNSKELDEDKQIVRGDVVSRAAISSWARRAPTAAALRPFNRPAAGPSSRIVSPSPKWSLYQRMANPCRRPALETWSEPWGRFHRHPPNSAAVALASLGVDSHRHLRNAKRRAPFVLPV